MRKLEYEFQRMDFETGIRRGKRVFRCGKDISQGKEPDWNANFCNNSMPVKAGGAADACLRISIASSAPDNRTIRRVC